MQYENSQGIFTYQFHTDSTIAITGYEGNHQYVIIPDEIDQVPVTIVENKAFLSQKNIEKLILPSHTKRIGDWAFAHMTELTTLEIPASEILLGKQALMDCPKLEEIGLLNPAGDSYEDLFIPHYTASIMQVLKDPLLFTPQTIGTPEWYHSFDAAVLRLLNRPDDDGFEPVFYGWFEVEDISVTQLPAYVKKRRFEKASLSMKRLLSPVCLSDDVKSEYEDYVCKHMLTGIWDYILSDKIINDTAYLKLLLDIGCITENILDSCIQDLASHNVGEAVALLLQYKEAHFSKKDFFSNLNL